ncbi:hypothetical protein N480_06030 [Pseudoalteromonas luteoviolacea S2607]|uniref:Uncharacterized protein n=1 Tax=Pseudoalteromonas luteoviolacea S4060-1 TaxID=1365257 RepID=A0A162AL22_9GAMM|nr:hypothetical protein N480_06030 [Pseudoalteromonas luteoviolacea S2607]KZN61308.1 hypothetical protein N478_04385 [Pseudoalteromonas luteoviolacea S4060-1]
MCTHKKAPNEYAQVLSVIHLSECSLEPKSTNLRIKIE